MNNKIKSGLTAFVFFVVQICNAQWTRMADFAGGASALTSGFAISNKAYVLASDCSNQLWECNTATNVWIRKADFTGVCRDSGVGFSIDGKGYSGIGWENTNLCRTDWWEYNPLTDSWTQKTDFPGAARSNAWDFQLEIKDTWELALHKP